MANPKHIESHNKFSNIVRDSVIGLSDGLTVPFALAAGLSGAIDSTKLIVTAGVAEIAAGAIAMGLGGYMAAKAEADQYSSELKREKYEIEKLPHFEEKEVKEILEQYGLTHDNAQIIVDGLKANPQKWLDFMMRFELGLEKPNPQDLINTPLTIGIAYIIGGLVPLMPYILNEKASVALPISIVTTLIALIIFGALKGHFTGIGKLKSAFSTTIIGGLAAGVAFFVARLIG